MSIFRITWTDYCTPPHIGYTFHNVNIALITKLHVTQAPEAACALRLVTAALVTIHAEHIW